MLLSTLVTLLAIAVAAGTYQLAGRSWQLTRRSAGRRLLALAAAVAVAGALAWLVLVLAGQQRPAGTLVGLLVIAALAVAVTCIVSLCTERAGPRGWAVIIACLVAMMATVTFSAWTPAVTLVVLPLTWRTPWLVVRTRLAVRAALLVGGVLVLALWGGPLQRAAAVLPAGPGRLTLMGIACVLSFAGVLVVKQLYQLPGRLFDLLRLRSRLVISYTLVAGPMLLIAAFLVILALATMGSYRSALVANLTAPDRPLLELAGTLIEDPRLASVLREAAPHRHARFDSLVREHVTLNLGTSTLEARRAGVFVLAERRRLGDGGGQVPGDGGGQLPGGSAATAMSAAPQGLVPAAVRSLHGVSTAAPLDGFVIVDTLLYATHGVTRRAGDTEHQVQVFERIDQQILDAAARLTSIEFVCVFTDSLPFTLGGVPAGHTTAPVGITTDPDGYELRIASSGYAATAEDGFYLGVQSLPVHRLSAGGGLRTAGGLLVVRAQWSTLFAAITDTVRNPFNKAIVAVLVVIAALILAIEVLAIVTGAAIARNLHRAVMQLTRGTRRLADDDLGVRLEIDRGDELGELSAAFNAMAEGLEERRRLTVERQRLASELAVAHDIQQRMLPAVVPEVPGLELAGLSAPSRQVGGDGYDFVRWGDHGLAVTIADVSGKGVPASLLMSNLQASVRTHARRPAPLDQVLAELNQLFVTTTDAGRFITFFLGVIEPASGELRYANAGHNPPFLVRADGACERLEVGGLLLGAVPEAEYVCDVQRLAAGDVLVLFTDGVVESRNAQDEYFDDDRLEALLRGPLRHQPAAVIRDRIVEEARAFAGGDEHADDLTVVVVRRL